MSIGKLYYIELLRRPCPKHACFIPTRQPSISAKLTSPKDIGPFTQFTDMELNTRLEYAICDVNAIDVASAI